MSENEDNRFGGRARRYVQVGSKVGALAARLAGERYLGLKLNRTEHAEGLKQALGGLKGPLMKVAQILATIPDALPKEYAEELQQLQSNAPAMGWLFVKRRMAAELGPDWRARFAEFGQEAAAAASLGQVHRATGKDGAELACKLQYPDMQSAVEADLKQLKLAMSVYERYDKAISTSRMYEELSARLREELDYQLEARHMALYADMLAGESGVHVPVAVPELSTKRLLTMNWLDGAPLLSVTGHDLDFRNKVALNMFRAWYVPFYFFGAIHGDPHLGNYSVRPDGSVNLLDFGCVRVFRPDFVAGVIDLYKALRDGDDDLAVHAYTNWGFDNLTKDKIEVLNLWARFIYAPLMEDRQRPIQETNNGMYGREVAEKVHAELRRIGGVAPPREFVLMDRAAIGLGSVFLHLKAEINWYRMFHEMIADFDVTELEKRQAKALTAAQVPAAA
ncbi:ABC1 kinase family protein [Oceanibaculum nanhaiense]|uniref:ABC1 kinase family protein n=1 Tax=Oceanibaculum nanhaiense TaxID=1909734 RepID=UPI000A3A4253|nr:AarF/ABC1/UbiB kinase family protein [Oceanibaculum nanhaiense]MDM7945210.1 AarF/ABC1/UbiB kinase family protein [Oceanibaculum nanhaiense]